MPIASGFGVVLKRGDPFAAGVVVYSIEFLSKHCAIECAVCADGQKQDKVDRGPTKAFQKNSLCGHEPLVFKVFTSASLRRIFALTKSSVSVKPVMIWHKR